MISLVKNNETLYLNHMIESLRKEMIRIGTQEGLNSKRTIEISRKLDKYISKCQALK